MTWMAPGFERELPEPKVKVPPLAVMLPLLLLKGRLMVPQPLRMLLV